MNCPNWVFAATTIALVVSGCSTGGARYQPPSYIKISNVKTISKPRDQVWNAAVPAIGTAFYVINTVDKASGLINVSYSGNPLDYVDCGHVFVEFNYGGQNRGTNFRGSSPQQQYQIPLGLLGVGQIDRKLSLEGRVNLIFEEVNPAITRVTVNVRYTVNRTQSITNLATGGSQTVSHTIAFNTGNGESFPASTAGQSTYCVPSGKLESDLLGLIN